MRYLTTLTQQTRFALIGAFFLSLCSLAGCIKKDAVTTYDKTESGKNWVKSESIQEYRGTNGKRIKEKQFVYEKVKCVGKKGETISVNTEEECFKKGGKIVDVFISEEQTLN